MCAWGRGNTLLIVIRSPYRDKMNIITVITLPFVSDLPSVRCLPTEKFVSLHDKNVRAGEIFIYRIVKKFYSF